jgi:hypothetical protein
VEYTRKITCGLDYIERICLRESVPGRRPDAEDIMGLQR